MIKTSKDVVFVIASCETRHLSLKCNLRRIILQNGTQPEKERKTDKYKTNINLITLL